MAGVCQNRCQMTTVHGRTRYARRCRNEPALLPVRKPRREGDRVPARLRGQRHANSTAPGIRLPELDLSCQMPVPSNVSRPSTNTRAWPASQQLSPSVPSSAIAEPWKRITPVEPERARDQPSAPGPGGRRRRRAGRDRARGRDLESQPAVRLPGGDRASRGGGPSKKRPNEPSGARAESAAAAFVRIQLPRERGAALRSRARTSPRRAARRCRSRPAGRRTRPRRSARSDATAFARRQSPRRR